MNPLWETQMMPVAVMSAQRRLARRNRAANCLADQASHDFRGALTIITEYLSLFQDGLCGDVTDEQRRVLEILDDRTNDLNHMVEDLFDLNRLHTRGLTVHRRNCELSEIIKCILPAIAKKAEFKGLEINCALAAELPDVYCDPELVGRALRNLVLHAIKLCPHSGVIRLSAQPLRDEGLLTVGVRWQTSRAGDDPLSEGDVSWNRPITHRTGDKKKSCQLGLTVARKLIARNFGTLIESTDARAGGSLSFDVPLAAPDCLLQHYLASLTRGAKRCPAVSAVCVRVESPADREALAALDNLLQDCLSRRELLLRKCDDEWLLILADGVASLPAFAARLLSARRDMERQESDDALPEVDFAEQKTWSTATGTVDIVRDIIDILSEPESKPWSK